MASNNNTPVQIMDEDDDEFDWEAAVREIDVACEVKKPSTSTNLCSKQSTLDKFLGKVQFNQEQEQEFNEPNEKICCVDIDAEAATTWIYPVNVPIRDYQFAITKRALFSNTLVALPTGLGKTLIAAVVMFNYFRWFPNGKIVFAAPSRPLVMQQIEACHNIVGIPQEWTIDMTGQISPSKRACFWKTKRVFFVTPQVLEKDIQSGTCLVKYLVCLVIDEAHRALGNYSYCTAVREIMSVPVQLRILALTATPGSKQQTIQHIIDNLHISTLEYRNESDDDVSPYVHNRKIELIEVAMGQEAAEINNLILEIIRPYVTRLSTIGLLQNRDYRTLSPVDLLNSRDKFRQAPPPNLPHVKFGEVETFFGALITLYHIRRLLSSHGIRPAYEMLEEKLQQGPFARLMSRNEVIQKVKLLMQQSISHGAPSPKLSKMLKVLVDHFKTKDPKCSRVIIFSNFRGSVRDIMDALANIGDLVKATEFIGQSSGKALKGQSQKVQQAVLEKFRAGGYNVIVATSIGEEGLDIMEVDLVICFDANVSPLRMIQRMGRTGRKHDGRVVVLACEGSELKGYMRKQASGKAIKKHMHNGGMNSFNFHPSPRMIPHIFKPEIRYVELSIEQFVSRGKKVKDDHAIGTPVFKEKLTVAETDLIAKYFQHSSDNASRLSLIAFPHFQAFPSRVHKVMHSYRTGMLIDMMQHLQGLTFSSDSRTFVEDVVSSSKCLGVQSVEKCENDNKDSLILDNFEGSKSLKEVTEPELSPVRTLRTEKKHNMSHFSGKNSAAHSYLFGSDFVSVDALGKVLIVSLPSLCLQELSHSEGVRASSTMLQNHCKEDSFYLKTIDKNYDELAMQVKAVGEQPTSQTHSKGVRASSTLLQNHWKEDSFYLKTTDKNYDELAMQAKAVGEQPTSQTTCIKNSALQISSPDSGDQQEKALDRSEKILETPVLKRYQLNEEDMTTETFEMEIKESSPQTHKYDNDLRDAELSPRLTNFIKSGVVPESPINESGLLNNKGRNEFLIPDFASPVKLCCEQLTKSSSLRENGRGTMDNNGSRREVPVSPINNECQTPLLEVSHIASGRGCTSASPVAEETKIALTNITNTSCSRDWHLSSEDKSQNVNPVRKLKRLRKVADCVKQKHSENMKDKTVIPGVNLAGSFSGTSPIQNKHGRGKRKTVDNVRAFIEEEAEVSSEAEISDDEEDDLDNNSYDDSFIDDRINPTTACTQAESSGVDMVAIYRRSLLSQSPVVRSAIYSPDYATPMTRTSDSRSSSVKTLHSVQALQTDSKYQSTCKNSEPFQINQEIITSGASACKSSDSTRENERKRKLSFYQLGSIPMINLEREFSFQSEATGKESCQEGQANNIDANVDALDDDDDDDDQFYEHLDLDAVEEHATLLLKQKSEVLVHEQETVPQSKLQNLGVEGSPSFDLGI